MCSTIRQATYERELETKWQNMHENWKLCTKCTQRATNNGSQQQKTTVWVCMCVSECVSEWATVEQHMPFVCVPRLGFLNAMKCNSSVVVNVCV